VYKHLARARHMRSSEARHMRSSEDMEAILYAAHVRRDRRLREVMRMQGGFPTPEIWRTLDLAHEATYLIDRLEKRVVEMYESEAEAWWMARGEDGLLV
jgi:hypothetical protein